MRTKVCRRCEEPGPWKRTFSAKIIQEVEGIDSEQQLHVNTVDKRVSEQRSYECVNCGWQYPAGIWWNGLEEITVE